VPSVTKLSVSVPSQVWNEVERLLGRPGETRSALVARVLDQAARAARDAEIAAEYERAYHQQPETDEERALHEALVEGSRRRFAELDHLEAAHKRAANHPRRVRPNETR
jgi:metal-responsive CopG/Arc/MetJ family transcriptional regulator